MRKFSAKGKEEQKPVTTGALYLKVHTKYYDRLSRSAVIGRVRSIVNYDKTYGIFLRGFANKRAVSNSVIYDTALLW